MGIKRFEGDPHGKRMFQRGQTNYHLLYRILHYSRQYPDIRPHRRVVSRRRKPFDIANPGIFDRYLHITIPYTAINVLLNAIPVYIGFRFIGKKIHALFLSIFLTGFLTDSLPAYTITSDILLISIFGGLINGFAISLCSEM